MSSLKDVKGILIEDASASAEYVMKKLGVTKPYAYALLSKGRKELSMVKQRDGTWAHKLRMTTRSEKIVKPAIYETLTVATTNESVMSASTSSLDVQVGGDHYKEMKIQPVEFITANNLGFLEGCIVKRICRWKDKDGLKDLEKIKHEVDLLIELNKLK